MKCQFHLLTHVNDGGLQMYSEKYFHIYSHEFNFFFFFFQIFVFNGNTSQFFGEITAYQ